jgi:hypothetical protein
MLRDFKISFYVHLHADKLFGSERASASSSPWGVVVRRDDEHRTAVKENNGGG